MLNFSTSGNLTPTRPGQHTGGGRSVQSNAAAACQYCDKAFSLKHSLVAGGQASATLHASPCMHPRRREIGFMPASARFAARVSKVEERPEGAHDVVAQRHARSQVTAVQQVLEAGKQLQKCVSSQCRKIMITLVRFLLHKQYYQRDHHPSHGSDELNNDEDSECICFMIS